MLGRIEMTDSFRDKIIRETREEIKRKKEKKKKYACPYCDKPSANPIDACWDCMNKLKKGELKWKEVSLTFEKKKP